MPDASDILEDPTAELNTALALAEDGQAHDAMDCFMRLHRHKKAGGSLPQQERGEGTAVGELLGEVADFRKAAADWSLDLQQQAVAQLERADDLRRRSSAVTGEV